MTATKKELMNTETREISAMLFQEVEKLNNKKNKDRLLIACAIIGAIATILAGVWFVFDLRFEPVERRLDYIEKKIEVMDTRIKSDDELKFLVYMMIKDNENEKKGKLK